MRHLFIGTVFFLGCGTSIEVEPQLTITQGVYGQLTERCDSEDCVGAARVGTPVAWFDGNPFTRNDAGMLPAPSLELVSGRNGFYEFPLDAGVRGYLAIGKQSTTNGVQWFSAKGTVLPLGLGRVDWRASADNEGIWTNVK